MTAFRTARIAQRYRATLALIAFVAATLVAMLAPVVQGNAYELVCSAQGNRLVALSDGVGESGHGSTTSDHTAHCPLCMPVGSPPAELVLDFTPVRVHAPERDGIPATRIAVVVGASLPARGPPSLS